jgi:predicted NAD-dependent protein-ADP-ribosyltransferase YbiA (DUF1768 family)
VRPEDVCLNNYEPSPFTLDGEHYKSVEHFYQSEKYRGYSPDGESIRVAVMGAEDADRCKKLARKYEDANKAAGV